MNQWTEAIPWIIAAGGLGATHLFSEARERRKEVRGQLDKIFERLSKLEELGREFHTGSAFSERKAQAIVADLDRLERAIARVAKFDVSVFAGELIAHKQSLTLTNFDRSSFKTQSDDCELLRNVAEATAECEEALEAYYRGRYPASFPYFSFLPASHRAWREVGDVVTAFAVGILIGGTVTYIIATHS